MPSFLKKILPAYFFKPEVQLFVFAYAKKVRYCYVALARLWWLWVLPFLMMALSSVIFKDVYRAQISFLIPLVFNMGTAFIIIFSYSAARPAISLKSADYFAKYSNYFVWASVLFGCLLSGGSFIINEWITPYVISCSHQLILLLCSLLVCWPFFNPTLLFDMHWFAWLLATPWCAWIFLLYFDGIRVQKLIPDVLYGMIKNYVQCVSGYAAWLCVNRALYTILEITHMHYLFGYDWYVMGMGVLLPLVIAWWQTVYVYTVYKHPAPYITDETC
jgi:hypothetical protein